MPRIMIWEDGCFLRNVETDMFRRSYVFAAAALLMLLLAPFALAEEAQDFTAECRIERSAGKYKIERVYDRDFGTYWESDSARNQYIQLTAPQGKKISGVYVCFWDKLRPWRIEVLKDGKWTEAGEYEARFAHEYVPLDEVDGVKIMNASGTRNSLKVNEIYVFSQGDIPSWVQRWETPAEKADILFMVAHPDDEILFFGGAIPYYAGELHKNVQVAYLTCNTSERRSELLNVTWYCGVRAYPDVGDLWDKYTKHLDKQYAAWGKKETFTRVCELYRRYRPDVVVTHDVKGEYGHGAHLACADAALRCVEWAADETKYTSSVKEYGTWQVKKLYYHLGSSSLLEMNWDEPLEAFGGKTGFEIAQEAYKLYVSQQNASQKNPETGKWERFVVEPRTSQYSCYLFSLVHSAVGEDTQRSGFLENIN